ncbi:MAG: sugar phosphate isomerase/epimerase family protein [Saprospiraceae bacterium]
MMRPKLAAFPKAYMKALCKEGTMKLSDWIKMASTLNIQGLEWYAGFLEMKIEKNWISFRAEVESHGMVIPMMCCSPDFTHPEKKFHANEIAKQKKWIDTIHALGGKYCRVLSGQRRPEISIQRGIGYTIDCIHECLPYAQSKGIILNIENHYKDDFWDYPEFAQKMDIFCAIVDGIDHPHFGVNYDPSNTYIAGEDPLDLLYKISNRIVTMHASDRYLKYGTIQDLRNEEDGSQGYVERLSHGEIGKGLNDYHAIFTELKRVGFTGWISIEDGVDGFDQMQRSTLFLKNKILEYWNV